MEEKKDLPEEKINFLKNLFSRETTAQKEGKSEAKKKKKGEPCPYCGKKFKRVASHLPYCNQNPENQKTTPEGTEQRSHTTETTRARKKKVIVEEEMVERAYWSELLTELKPLLNNLTTYIKKLNNEPLKVQIVNPEE
ncbi:MAG: hypothetical protein R6U96_13510 [Promethearchaeia archaeon]